MSNEERIVYRRGKRSRNTTVETLQYNVQYHIITVKGGRVSGRREGERVMV
jgi:hypothetical protein